MENLPIFQLITNLVFFPGIATTLHHVDEEIEEDAEVNQLTQNAAITGSAC